MKAPTDSQEEKPLNWVPIAIGVFALWVLGGLGTTVLFPGWTERGQFGDAFGAVNALFSALGLAALIYTVYLQRKDLALQREEFRNSVAELKRSANAQEEAHAAIRLQSQIELHAARVNALGALIDHLNHYERLIQDGKGGQVLRHPAYERDKHVEALREELERMNTLSAMKTGTIA